MVHVKHLSIEKNVWGLFYRLLLCALWGGSCLGMGIAASQERIALCCENMEELVGLGVLTREEADSFVANASYVATLDGMEELVFLPGWHEDTIARIRPFVHWPGRLLEEDKIDENQRRHGLSLGLSHIPFKDRGIGKPQLHCKYKQFKPGFYRFLLHVDKEQEDRFSTPYARFSLMVKEKMLGHKTPIQQVVLGKYNVQTGAGLIVAGSSSNGKGATPFFTKNPAWLKLCGSKIRNHGLAGIAIQGGKGANRWAFYGSKKAYQTMVKDGADSFSSIPNKHIPAFPKVKKGGARLFALEEGLVGSVFRRTFAQGHLGLQLLYHGYKLPYRYASSLTKKVSSVTSNGGKHHFYLGGFGKVTQKRHDLMASFALAGNRSFALVLGDKICFGSKKKQYLAIVGEHYGSHFYNLHGNGKTNEQNFLLSLCYYLYRKPLRVHFKYHKLLDPSLQTRRQKSSVQGVLAYQTALLPQGLQNHEVTLGQQEYRKGKKPVQVTYKVEHCMKYRAYHFKTFFACSKNLLGGLHTLKGKWGQEVVYQAHKVKVALKGFFVFKYGGGDNEAAMGHRFYAPVWHLCLNLVYGLYHGICFKVNLAWKWGKGDSKVPPSFSESLHGVKVGWELLFNG